MKVLKVLTFNSWRKSQVHDLLQATPAIYQHQILHVQEPHPSTPSILGYRLYLPTDTNSRPRAATYVADSIPPSATTQIPCATPDMVILHIANTTQQPTRFVNIYNDCHTQAALLHLSEIWMDLPAAPQGSHVSGDFNLHHPLWASATRNITNADIAKADTLLDLLDLAGLQLLMEPGLPTFLGSQRRAQPTTIDLVWGKGHLVNDLIGTHILEAALGSDHQALSTTYAFDLHHSINVGGYLWAKTDWDMFRAIIGEAGNTLPPLPSSDVTDPQSQLDACATALESMISGAVRQVAPRHKPGARCHPWWTPELTALHQAATMAKRAVNRHPNHPATRDHYRHSDARLRHSLKQARKQHTELRLSSANRTNFWHIYRALKDPEHTKVVKPLLKEDGTLTQSPLETAEHLKAAWFPPRGRTSLRAIPTQQTSNDGVRNAPASRADRLKTLLSKKSRRPSLKQSRSAPLP